MTKILWAKLHISTKCSITTVGAMNDGSLQSGSNRRTTIPFFWKTTCHTCRASKIELERRRVDLNAIDIIKRPPSKRVLKLLARKYGVKNMIRRNSKDYKALGVGKMKLTENRIVGLLHSHPDLAARPIVITKKNGPFLSRDPEFLKNLKRS